MVITVSTTCKNENNNKFNGEVDVEMSELKKAIFKFENFVQNYCPGYKIIIPPTRMKDDRLLIIFITGASDYLPSFAGNLI